MAPMGADAEETSARWGVYPLELAVPLIRECPSPIADEAGQLIVGSDAAGLILWIAGNARVRFAAADSMNRALQRDRPRVDVLRRSGHDPDTGNLLGIIDVTGRMRTVHIATDWRAR